MECVDERRVGEGLHAQQSHVGRIGAHRQGDRLARRPTRQAHGTVVAALGYGDIPTEAFLSACEFIPEGGWIVFNIKEDFLVERGDQSGFSALVRSLQRDGLLEVQAMRRYRHRLSIHGEPLHYVAIVGMKTGDIGRPAS